MDEAIQNEFIISPGIRSNPAEVIVEAKHLSKRYKGCLALNDVSFDIHRGDLIGLVGKNGAGKTTLIRVLTGVAHPTSGTFSLFGASDPKGVTKNLAKVAAMVEQPALYNSMILKNSLLDYWHKIHREHGYLEVETPTILSRELWETSGHWEHYKENMDEERHAILIGEIFS